MQTLALYWPVEKLWTGLVAGSLVLWLGLTSALRNRRSIAHVLGGATSAIFGGLVAVWAVLMLCHL